MRCKLAAAMLLTTMLCSAGYGEPWAEKMFETTRHDFGSVARDAKTEYEFVLENIYLEDVHISSVRTSCGCTTPRIKEQSLKTYEKGAIIARFNTPTFRGHKSATITVTFDRPRYAQVQLHVKGNIRRDVVLQPGSVQLGTVDQGSPAEKKITITRTGRSDWEILEVQGTNPHVSGRVVETRRRGGRVSYDLFVRLAEDAPAGYLRGHLLLVTNDGQTKQIPVAIEGVVQSGITVSPNSLYMGVVRPGQSVTKQFVVRGKRPFRITSVGCESDKDGCFEFGTSEDQESKSLHLVPVTFVAGETPGKVTQTIRIETDQSDFSPHLSAYAVVSP